MAVNFGHGAQNAAKGIHVIQAYEFANAADRSSFSNEVNGRPAPTPADVGRVAIQTDNSSFWVLTDDAPITWAQLGLGGAGTVDHGTLIGLGDDDHLQYLTEARHDSLPSDNPHGVTAAQAGADPAGTAAAAIAAHEAAADPHPNYVLESAVNDRYYEVFDSSAQVLTGTDAVIVMDTQESANPNFSLSAGSVACLFTGRVKCTFAFSGDSTNGTRSIARSTIYLNAAAQARAFVDTYHRTTGAGESTASKSVLLNVGVGNTINLRSRILAGSGITSVANGCGILLERIQ